MLAVRTTGLALVGGLVASASLVGYAWANDYNTSPYALVIVTDPCSNPGDSVGLALPSPSTHPGLAANSADVGNIGHRPTIGMVVLLAAAIVAAQGINREVVATSPQPAGAITGPIRHGATVRTLGCGCHRSRWSSSASRLSLLRFLTSRCW